MPIIHTSPSNSYVVTRDALRDRYDIRMVGPLGDATTWHRVLRGLPDEAAAIKAADQLDEADLAGEFDALA